MRTGLAAAGIRFDAGRGNYSYQSGGAAMAALAKLHRRRFAAVVAASDIMALNVLDHAQHILKLRLPGDVSFAGFD